ncbi:MAG: alpha/beta hydrolase-fold protein [Saprospiraceae bacterium]
MNFWQKPIETIQELLQRKAPHLRQIRHFESPALEREVDFDIHLPADYHLSRNRQYPLIIFNDGQDLPRMRFANILQEEYYHQRIPGCIVVGIYATHDRYREYGTSRQVDYKGRGDKAGAHAAFVVSELMPYLRRRFRVSGLVEETIIAGFSLGGLSALDIAWGYPGLFGAVGIFSGALWWRWSPVDNANPDADRIMHDIIDNGGDANGMQRYWFQCGTLDETDDRNGNGIIDSIDDTLHLIDALHRKGCPREAVRYLEIKDGRHEPSTWGAAMPDFLNFVL